MLLLRQNSSMLLYGIPQHLIFTISKATPLIPKHRPTATITTRTAMATAQSPFFRLPRELRDSIYDLVALDAESLYYEFLLKEGEPVQKRASVTSDVSRGCPPLAGECYSSTGNPQLWQTTPEKTGCENSLDRVCKQFTVECSAAVERRMERLLSFRRDEARLTDCFWKGEK
jgi:hypothetical protein